MGLTLQEAKRLMVVLEDLTLVELEQLKAFSEDLTLVGLLVTLAELLELLKLEEEAALVLVSLL